MSEARAFGRLAARGAGGLTAMLHETHRAVSRRAFRAAPGAAGVRVVHDAISALVYSAVRAGTTAAVHAGSVAAEARGAALTETTRGRLVVGAVNGAWGDLLEHERSPLAVHMHVPDLAEARAAATPRLAVVVHGLCETEDAWRLGADRCTPYAERLRTDFGFTPLVLRYNTGRRISQNGRQLAEMLEHVVADWPVGVEDIVFVGHSMGGLVARSACHHASEDELGWVRRVSHVFSLGSPLNGADLEKAANVAGWALNQLPETRALARALNRRSAGIKDLRYGNLTDGCWDGHDPDELLTSRRCDVPWLETAQHTFIAASLSADPDHPLGRLAGDLLVRRPSAWAGGQHGEKGQFLIDSSHCIGPANHFTLLNHPDVYEQISVQLRRARGLPSPREEAAAAI